MAPWCHKSLDDLLPLSKSKLKNLLLEQEFPVRILWLGNQVWNQTFEDDPDVDVAEIRRLLEGDDCGGETSVMI